MKKIITLYAVLAFSAAVLTMNFFSCKSVETSPKYRCGTTVDKEKKLLAATDYLDLNKIISAENRKDKSSYRQTLIETEKKYRNNTVVIPAYTEYEIAVNGY